MCRANSGGLSFLIVIVCSIKLQCNPIEIQHDYRTNEKGAKNGTKKVEKEGEEERERETFVEITITIHI